MATSCRLTAREWSGVILAWGVTSGWQSPRAQLPRHADDISAKCDVFLGCMHFFFSLPLGSAISVGSVAFKSIVYSSAGN